ncbi:MAG: hypothetical protein PUP91_20785 [Rhizonema sp. PD37]|nr:hypothetical protein [Rhizonema sp. PD37]
MYQLSSTNLIDQPTRKNPSRPKQSGWRITVLLFFGISFQRRYEAIARL